jgi:hypothetical protein
VALSGKGVVPVTVSPTSLSFGSRTLGTTSSPKTVTITNTSGAVLALGEMSMFGDYAVFSTTCGTSLAAGARCTIAITFTPAYVVGVRLGTLSVVHGAFGSPLRIPLSGTATGDALLSLEVTPANPVIGLGHSQQFTATAHYTDGTSADVTDAVFWNAGFPMRGHVTTGGVYTVFASGTNPVTAQLGARSGSTTPAGASLNVSRAWGATATVLLDGRVLIAGGLLNEATAAVELFDPVAGTFTPAAPMTAAREGHTATRLSDGRVLVVGGFGPSGALKSAEVFDPAAGTWTATGSPVVRRGGHTASLIGAKVLVAGGINGTPVAFAELFDPASNAWVPTGSLNVARSAHAAATLADGRVLVTGGMNTSFNAIAAAEIYNPAGGFWTSTAPMSTVRELHTATTLVNGDVLVVGGATGSGALASAELFHPASGTWSASAPLPVPSFDHTATRLTSGEVLVAGGIGTGYDDTPATFATLYDALGSTVGVAPRLVYHRYSHSAVALNDGRVLLLGGYYWGTTAEIRNPDVTPVFLSVSPFTRTAAVGETATFIAQVQFSDGSFSYATEAGTWSVSPESVATVVGPGSVKALAPGVATVTVKVGSLEALATLQVP